MKVNREPETVILCVCDSLRVDSAKAHMPFLSSLAAQNTSVDRLITPGSGTPSSMPGIMQSRLPVDHGGWGMTLRPDVPTLAEMLEEDSVATLGLHSNQFTSTTYDFGRGFDTIADLADGSIEYSDSQATGGGSSGAPSIDSKSATKRPMDALRRVTEAAGVRPKARRVFNELQRWGVVEHRSYARADEVLEQLSQFVEHSDSRRFAWMQLMDTHSPFEPPREYRETVSGAPVSARRVYDLNQKLVESPGALSEAEISQLRSLYQAEARFVDDHLREFVDELKEMGEWDSTALIITGDHGELFGERDVPGYGYDVAHPNYLCAELTQVPLWVLGGAVEEADIDTPTSGMDLAPTIADAFNIEPAPEWDGVVIGSDEHQNREFVVSALAHTRGEGVEVDPDELHVAVRDEDYAVLWWLSGEQEIYRRVDGTEKRVTIEDLDADARERVTKMLDVAKDTREQNSSVSREGDAGGMVNQRLQDLGYVQ